MWDLTPLGKVFSGFLEPPALAEELECAGSVPKSIKKGRNDDRFAQESAINGGSCRWRRLPELAFIEML
jgi:hypothetical protein